jgi:hypothetical protein
MKTTTKSGKMKRRHKLYRLRREKVPSKCYLVPLDSSSDDEDDDFLFETAFMMPIFIEEHLTETDCMSHQYSLQQRNSNANWTMRYSRRPR